MDVLSDVLKTVRLTGSIFFTSDLYEPWSVSSPPKELLRLHIDKRAECISLFHIITEGSCNFKTKKGRPFVVGQVSVIIFPHSHEHIMCSNFDLSPVPVAQLLTPDTLSGKSMLSMGVPEGSRNSSVDFCFAIKDSIPCWVRYQRISSFPQKGTIRKKNKPFGRKRVASMLMIGYSLTSIS